MADIGAVEVYWRPGCPFCDRLMRALDDADVRVRLHDIWQDDEARALVRSHNRGNETVPTVVVGELVLTNPHPVALLSQLRADFAHLIGSGGPEPATGR